jgi:hypothetical protein
MEDDDAHKGRAVTKPIDLRAKKAIAPIRGAKKNQSADLKVSSAEEARAPTPVGALAAARVRAAVPKPEIIDQIGLRLRGVYNDVLMQPIPERFIDLLGQLEAGCGAHQEASVTGSKKGGK